MFTLKFFAVVLILLVSIFPIFVCTTLASSSDTAVSDINRAEDVITLAYEGILEAEEAGADVSGLITQLNIAGELLAEAHTSYRLKDFDEVVRSANICYEMGEEVRIGANRLRDLAVEDGLQRFRSTMIWAILEVALIAGASFLGWFIFKRHHLKRVLRMKPEVV